jgi:hypothetical protein
MGRLVRYHPADSNSEVLQTIRRTDIGEEVILLKSKFKGTGFLIPTVLVSLVVLEIVFADGSLKLLT